MAEEYTLKYTLGNARRQKAKLDLLPELPNRRRDA
jgi:hypothetical protein